MRNTIGSITNRQINLTYIIAGCLLHSFDDMQEYLRRSASELNHENKQILNEMIKLCTRYEYLCERLRRVSITTLSEQNMVYHNDAIDKYYSLLMTMVTRIGSDDDSELRAYALMKEISKYPSKLHFPKKETLIDKVAWGDMLRRVEEEGITDEQLLKTLKELPNE